MDPEEEKQGQDQPSINDQGLTKKIARKGLDALRGFGVAGEAAEAEAATAGAELGASAAGEGLAAGGVAAAGETGVAAAGVAATEGTTVAAAGTAGSGMAAAGTAVFMILFIIVITIILTIIGGGAGVNAGVPPPTNSICGVGGLGGRCESSCATDEQPVNGSFTDCVSPNICCVSQTPPPSGSNFYCQYGPVNSEGILKDYGGWDKSCDISTNGCFPTSIANVLTAFGDSYTPTEVGLKNNVGCFGATTSTTGTFNWLKDKGYKTQDGLANYGSDLNVNLVKKLTSEGYYVVAGACITVSHSYSAPLMGPVGHAIVITGVNSNNTLNVLDPTFCASNHHGIRVVDPTVPGPDIKTTVTADGCHFPGWGYATAVKKPGVNPGGGGNNEPTSNVCNGKWANAMSSTKDWLVKKGWQGYNGDTTKVNFGDPICTYSKANWETYLKQIEKNSDLWPFWKDIGDTEGSINTGGGAGWGKFQMNTNFSKGIPDPFRQPQKGSIRGDVTWQNQIETAVSWNNGLIKNNNAFEFWGTAYCMCYFDYYANHKSWCGDIVHDGLPRSPEALGGNCQVRTDCLGKQHGWAHGGKPITAGNPPSDATCSNYNL